MPIMDDCQEKFAGKLLLTSSEAAALLNVSPRTVFSLRKAKKLPATLVGGSVRYHVDVINAFIRRQTEGGN